MHSLNKEFHVSIRFEPEEQHIRKEKQANLIHSLMN